MITKKTIDFDGIKFDSEEERLFYIYVNELKDRGYIDEYEYHTNEYNLFDPVKIKWIKQLKTKQKNMEKSLLQGHIYTPDFHIFWTLKAYKIFYCDITDGEYIGKVPFVNNVGQKYEEDRGTIIEIKPSFDFQNMSRMFIINQKWMWQKHDLYVQKIVPQKLFEKTFTPEKALYTKTGKIKKYKFKIRSFDKFIGGTNAKK